VIAIVGTPAWSGGDRPSPAGRACRIALAAATAGSQVELVGRTGDDPAGDALLLALAHAGVGHVAMLRDPARPTPIVEPEAEDAEDAEDAGDLLDPSAPTTTPVAVGGAPRLEAADVSLGLRYLPGFDVLVVAEDVPADALPVAVEAAEYAGAQLVVLVRPGTGPVTALPSSTVLEVPDDGGDGPFGELVGRYAAAIDRGASPEAAFASATGDGAWDQLPAEPA